MMADDGRKCKDGGKARVGLFGKQPSSCGGRTNSDAGAEKDEYVVRRATRRVVGIGTRTVSRRTPETRQGEVEIKRAGTRGISL